MRASTSGAAAQFRRLGGSVGVVVGGGARRLVSHRKQGVAKEIRCMQGKKRRKGGFASEILTTTKENLSNAVNGRTSDGFQNRKALKPGKVTEMRKVYEDTPKPHYAESGVLPPYENSKWQFARTADEIEGMRGAGPCSVSLGSCCG